jgi:hypothetical protein
MHTVPLGQALGAPTMQAQPEQQLFPQAPHQLSVHGPPLQQRLVQISSALPTHTDCRPQGKSMLH